MKTMSRLALALSVAAFASPALAATSTGTFTVTAFVQRSCTVIATNTLQFGTSVTSGYDPLGGNLDASTTFQFRCNRGTVAQIGIEDGNWKGLATGGAGFGADRAMRGVTTNTEYLAYRLYTDVAGGTLWGKTPGTDTNDFTAAASSAPQLVTIYGRIPAGQDVSAQQYTDANVQITINY